MPRPPDVNEHRVTIHIDNHVYFVNVQYPQTILKAAKAKHIILPYSCEAGRCSSCAATCTSGKIWMAYNEVLTDDEVAKGRVLVCQAFPVGGDVEIVF
jgi:ring-1,2-phenylacetyl-CoA epoxidase subunit PaaE